MGEAGEQCGRVARVHIAYTGEGEEESLIEWASLLTGNDGVATGSGVELALEACEWLDVEVLVLRKPKPGERSGAAVRSVLAGARCPVWLVPETRPAGEDGAGAMVILPGTAVAASPVSGRRIPCRGYRRFWGSTAD